MAQELNLWAVKKYALDQLVDYCEVDFIDVSCLLDRDIILDKGIKIGRVSKTSKSCESLDRLEETILDCDWVFTFIGRLDERSRSIYQLLQRYSKKWVLVGLTSFPENTSTVLLKDVTRRIISKFLRERSVSNTIKRLSYILKSILIPQTFSPSFFLAGSNDAIYNHRGLFDDLTTVVRSCSYDYILAETARKASDSPRRKNRYWVFIDQNILQHSDFRINDASLEDSYAYRSEIQKFLAKFVKDQGCEMVIAVHPRSTVETASAAYGSGMEYVQGSTVELIAGCLGCITHSSAAAGLAVAMDKPLILLTTDRQQMSNVDLQFLATRLGLQPVNISRKYSCKSLVEESDVEGKHWNEALIEDMLALADTSAFGYGDLLPLLERRSAKAGV